MFNFDFVYLNAPAEVPISEHGTGLNVKYAAVSLQGWRRIQEDAMNCVLNYRGEETSSLFGIYDGHGGPEISVYVRNHLPGKLKEKIDETGDIAKALVQTFLELDEDLKRPETKPELIEILESYVDDPDGDNIQRVVMAMRAEQLKSTYGGLQPEQETAELHEESNVQDTDMQSVEKLVCDEDTPADLMDCPGTSGTSANVDEEEEEDDESSSTDGNSSGGEVDVTGPIELVRMSAPDVELIESDPEDSDYNPDSDSSGYENDSEDDRHVVRDMEACMFSGTTATVAVVYKDSVYVANAGDCRCVISRNYAAIGLTEDHKPENPEELKRIQAAGGVVNDEGRINDGLNLSRAIGDFVYKQNDKLPPESQIVTCVPDVRVHKLLPEDRFMVLACDGIWNSMTSQEIIDYVNLRLDSENAPLAKICEEIFYHILPPDPTGDGTGLDNMSLIIVVFGDYSKVPDGKATGDHIKYEDAKGTAAESVQVMEI